MANMWLYACLKISGHASNEMKRGVLEDLLPDLGQDITELRNSLS